MKARQAGERRAAGAPDPVAAPGDGARPDRPADRPGAGFFAVCLAYCAIILDGSVLNVAIPAIRHDLLRNRVRTAAVISAGLMGFVFYGATLAAVGPRTPYLATMAGLLLTGGASTVAFSALTSLLMSVTPARQSGLGSGLQNTTRQAGALIAVSILGSVLNTGLPTGLPAGRLPVAFAILGVAVMAGITLGLITVRGHSSTLAEVSAGENR